MAFLPAMIPAALSALTAAGSAAGAGGLASAASIGSTILGTAGTAASALAEARASEYNAKLAEQQGKIASGQAALAASQAARAGHQRMAAARAGALQNGFELSGSVLDLLDATERQGDMDYLTAVYEGRMANAGHQADAGLSRSRAKGALAAGAIGAGTRMMSGVADHYRSFGGPRIGAPSITSY